MVAFNQAASRGDLDLGGSRGFNQRKVPKLLQSLTRHGSKCYGEIIFLAGLAKSNVFGTTFPVQPLPVPANPPPLLKISHSLMPHVLM
jgi:hypothetical protein